LHVEACKIDALADGVFMREVGARENVVDVDDRWRMLVVLLVGQILPAHVLHTPPSFSNRVSGSLTHANEWPVLDTDLSRMS